MLYQVVVQDMPMVLDGRKPGIPGDCDIFPRTESGAPNLDEQGAPQSRLDPPCEPRKVSHRPSTSTPDLGESSDSEPIGGPGPERVEYPSVCAIPVLGTPSVRAHVQMNDHE